MGSQSPELQTLYFFVKLYLGTTAWGFFCFWLGRAFERGKSADDTSVLQLMRENDSRYSLTDVGERVINDNEERN